MTTSDNVGTIIPTYRVDLESATDRSTSSIVTQGIATLTGQELDELEPLWDSVEPEALDSFVDHAQETATPCRLAFQHQGYTVEIVTDGELRITPIEEPPPRTA